VPLSRNPLAPATASAAGSYLTDSERFEAGALAVSPTTGSEHFTPLSRSDPDERLQVLFSP